MNPMMKMNATTPTQSDMHGGMKMGDGGMKMGDGGMKMGGGGMKMGGGGMGMGDMDGMQMYFMLGNQVTILFKQWKTTNTGELVASCFALFVLSILYEGLKVMRQILLNRAEKLGVDVYTNASNEDSTLTQENVLTVVPTRKKMQSVPHLVQTLLHMVQVFVGYLLMLVFMTFNVWLCVAVVLGSGVGYFLFGWKTTTVVSSGDHCN